MITDHDETNVQLSVDHEIIKKMESDHAHIAKYSANSIFDNFLNNISNRSTKSNNSQSQSDTRSTAIFFNANNGNNYDDDDLEDNDNDDDYDDNDHNGDGAMQETSFYNNKTVPDKTPNILSKSFISSLTFICLFTFLCMLGFSLIVDKYYMYP